MQNYNSYYFNIYRLLFNAFRLTLLAMVVALCFLQLSCRKQTYLEVSQDEKQSGSSENIVNINIAPAEELEKLPKIGQELARRIIEHRATHGKFRRVEHLILVQGMSDKKFRDIKNLIKIE